MTEETMTGQSRKGDNLILIGFMGAGKTSAGLYCAERWRVPFKDTDQMIEETAGKTISEIFASEGEAAFRRMETELLKKLLEEKRSGSGSFSSGTVLSVGGGLPMREENRVLLKKLGRVIWLKVSADTVLERLKGDTTRPLLQGGNVREKVERLQAERGPLYEEAAHYILTADGKSLEEISLEIEKKGGFPQISTDL